MKSIVVISDRDLEVSDDHRNSVTVAKVSPNNIEEIYFHLVDHVYDLVIVLSRNVDIYPLVFDVDYSFMDDTNMGAAYFDHENYKDGNHMRVFNRTFPTPVPVPLLVFKYSAFMEHLFSENPSQSILVNKISKHIPIVGSRVNYT